MSRFITLTDHNVHGSSSSPLILDADRIALLEEFDRARPSNLAGRGKPGGSGVGTRITLEIGHTVQTVYVTESIEVVAAMVRRPTPGTE